MISLVDTPLVECYYKVVKRQIQALLDRREDFNRIAKAANTSPEYLRQIAYGFSLAGHALARRIDRATKGGVSKGELRPDIFGA